ncbi:hypothetical protein B0H21DRAFT_459107 [Amylocystis lapponica]|nr:hypothetical protein B0H21DRAFT_459107 [Amylocystis lapponica]
MSDSESSRSVGRPAASAVAKPPGAQIRRRAAGTQVAKPNSSRAAGAGGSSNTMLKLYTDDSPGLRVPLHRSCAFALFHRLYILPAHFGEDHPRLYKIDAPPLFLQDTDWRGQSERVDVRPGLRLVVCTKLQYSCRAYFMYSLVYPILAGYVRERTFYLAVPPGHVAIAMT